MTNENINYFDFVKSQDKNSIFSNPNIKQLISEIMRNEKTEKPKFENEQEERVAKLYVRMYVSLVVVRMCRGEKLGVACQKSLELMNKLVKSKENDNNPISKYMVKAKERFNPEFAKINMKDENDSEKKLNPAQIKNLEQIFSNEFKRALETLNKMSQKRTLDQTLGETKTENQTQQKTKDFADAKQKTQQLIQQMLLRNTYQRAA